MPIKLPNVLSPSRTELAARCYRRHLLSDVAGRVKGKSPSAAFGTVMHGGVGNWWQFGDPTMALEETQKLWDEYEAQMNVKHSRELATNMINWYIQNVSLAGILPGEWKIAEDADGQPWCEQRVELHHASSILSFQIDRLLERVDDGALCLIDTKTAARLDERWERQWQLSLQQRLYSYGVYKTFGRPPTYTLIEGLLKDKKNPKSKYVVTDWDDEELEEAIRTWEFYAERDRLLLQSTGCARAAFEEAAVRAPYNPMDCHAYYQDCPFLELCHDSPKLRSSGLRAYEIYDLLE